MPLAFDELHFPSVTTCALRVPWATALNLLALLVGLGPTLLSGGASAAFQLTFMGFLMEVYLAYQLGLCALGLTVPFDLTLALGLVASTGLGMLGSVFPRSRTLVGVRWVLGGVLTFATLERFGALPMETFLAMLFLLLTLTGTIMTAAVAGDQCFNGRPAWDFFRGSLLDVRIFSSVYIHYVNPVFMAAFLAGQPWALNLDASAQRATVFTLVVWGALQVAWFEASRTHMRRELEPFLVAHQHGTLESFLTSDELATPLLRAWDTVQQTHRLTTEERLIRLDGTPGELSPISVSAVRALLQRGVDAGGLRPADLEDLVRVLDPLRTPRAAFVAYAVAHPETLLGALDMLSSNFCYLFLRPNTYERSPLKRYQRFLAVGLGSVAVTQSIYSVAASYFRLVF